MTLTNNVPFRFCHLGNDLFYAFGLFVVRKGDKSNIVSHIISDFLNSGCSVYELLDLEDMCIKKHGKDGSKLEDKSLHVCIDRELYNSYILRCKEYGVSPMVLGRALVLKYVKEKLTNSLSI